MGSSTGLSPREYGAQFYSRPICGPLIAAQSVSSRVLFLHRNWSPGVRSLRACDVDQPSERRCRLVRRPQAGGSPASIDRTVIIARLLLHPAMMSAPLPRGGAAVRWVSEISRTQSMPKTLPVSNRLSYPHGLTISLTALGSRTCLHTLPKQSISRIWSQSRSWLPPASHSALRRMRQTTSSDRRSRFACPKRWLIRISIERSVGRPQQRNCRPRMALWLL